MGPGEFGEGFSGGFEGKEVGVGRAGLQSVNGAIPAGFDRFKPDEPENEANLARSVFVELKYARSKLLGLAAVIQSRIRRCRVFLGRDLIVCPRAGQENQWVWG